MGGALASYVYVIYLFIQFVYLTFIICLSNLIYLCIYVYIKIPEKLRYLNVVSYHFPISSRGSTHSQPTAGKMPSDLARAARTSLERRASPSVTLQV